MKATIPWLGAVLCAGLPLSAAHAQYLAPPTPAPMMYAPGACAPEYYGTGPHGDGYGPGYYVRPPYPPVSGVAPPPWLGGYGCGSGCGAPPIVAFPTHPYARGPRDYFMWSEAQRELITRERRPPLVP